MHKVIAAIALSLTLIFLVKESVVALRTGPITGPRVSDSRQARPQTTVPAEKNVLFYPPVPRALPDFNKGYLFNEERMIEGTASEETGITDEEDTSELSVDMDTVYYAGSLIIGEKRKGLVSYPSPKATPLNRKLDKGRQAAPKASERNYAKLAVGDSFSGYEVVELEADRIVFKKGTESIEKMLIDPQKPRLAAPPLPKKETPRPSPAKTAKTNRVQLDKAGRPVQSPRTANRPTRQVPATIQVPGVPPQPENE